MKIIALLVMIFAKWSFLGVPLWVSLCLLVPAAVGLFFWYRRLKKRSEKEL
jgi:uncharacterized protein YneF (UPF0154 family)